MWCSFTTLYITSGGRVLLLFFVENYYALDHLFRSNHEQYGSGNTNHHEHRAYSSHERYKKSQTNMRNQVRKKMNELIISVAIIELKGNKRSSCQNGEKHEAICSE
jgi:hypothetical protein